MSYKRSRDSFDVDKGTTSEFLVPPGFGLEAQQLLNSPPRLWTDHSFSVGKPDVWTDCAFFAADQLGSNEFAFGQECPFEAEHQQDDLDGRSAPFGAATSYENSTGLNDWMSTVLASGFDDLELSGSSQEQVICEGNSLTCQDTCYGMLCRVNIRLVGAMPTVLECINATGTRRVRNCVAFAISGCEGKLFVTSDGALQIAQLNKHFDESLYELTTSKALKLQALVPKTKLIEILNYAKYAKDAHMNINVVVYGSAESSAGLAREFCKQKLFLQHPDWIEPGYQYHNPQMLSIPSEHKDESIQTDIKNQSVKEGVSLMDSVAEVYSMLTRDAHLEQLDGGDRLMTELLPHQQKALTFMKQREDGPLPDQFRLWTQSSIDTDVAWYHHRVVGMKARTLPKETGGGLLADEMGMGKTLATLALIVDTLEAAHTWTMTDTSHTDEDIPLEKKLSPATLVVVPTPLLLNTWLFEMQKHIRSPLKTTIYHGDRRESRINDLTTSDIVLTTYQTLVADARHDMFHINDIAWYRIVLDEAHFIRNPSTSLHRRVNDLYARSRWCLTGTPIQNTLDDLGALLAFLRIYPFDRLGIFRTHLTSLWHAGGASRETSQQSLATLLDCLCLRRTKELLRLNNIEEIVRSIHLTDSERLQYDQVKQDMKRALYGSLDDDDGSNRFGMFQAQLQLRLLCNHGTYQHRFHWLRSKALSEANSPDFLEDQYALLGRLKGDICSACRGIINDLDFSCPSQTQMDCGHALCHDCMIGNSSGCPVCEVSLLPQKHEQSTKRARLLSPQDNYFRAQGYSSKIQALLGDLKNHSESKSLVFSQWTTSLNLIERHLREHGFTYLRIDGTDSFKKRQAVLDEFKTHDDTKVLLMTTGVGAFGLDLIAANRVFLVEPQWNPSVELQAIGRTMRIGQHNKVIVTRYVVQNSVEKDMQDMQKGKLSMAGTAQPSSSLPQERNALLKKEK